MRHLIDLQFVQLTDACDIIKPQPKEIIIMNKYVVCFNVYPDFQKIRRRTVQAYDKQDAIAKVSHEVPGSFYHYIKEEK